MLTVNYTAANGDNFPLAVAMCYAHQCTDLPELTFQAVIWESAEAMAERPSVCYESPTWLVQIDALPVDFDKDSEAEVEQYLLTAGLLIQAEV